MNKRGKTTDTTSLSLEQANVRGWIHRDYLAHVLRWQHVVKKVRHGYADRWLLDVGCGKEAPLPFTLFSNQLNNKGGKGGYVGVDFGNKIEPHRYLQNAIDRKTFNAYFHPRYDFASLGTSKLPYGLDGRYHTVVCFEVIEHVEPFTAFKILQRIRDAVRLDGSAFVSTPVYDPKTGAADNHVNEMSWYGVEALMKQAGLEWTKCWGTFASQRDIKPLLEQRGYKALFDDLTLYHDSNVLANLFAPLFPQASRNCLWECHAVKPRALTSQELARIKPALNSSSEQWQKHLVRIMKELR